VKEDVLADVRGIAPGEAVFELLLAGVDGEAAGVGAVSCVT
jgi:hypothetical protein